MNDFKLSGLFLNPRVNDNINKESKPLRKLSDLLENKYSFLKLNDFFSSNIKTSDKKPQIVNLSKPENLFPLQQTKNRTDLVRPENLLSSLSLSNTNVTSFDSGVTRGNGATDNTVKALEGIPGKHWAGIIPGNGGRESAVLIPEGADFNKPFEVIYYFHGHNGQIQKSLEHQTYGFKNQIMNMEKDPEKNIIVVIPQGPPKQNNSKWMNSKFGNENMSDYQRESMNIIKSLIPNAEISSITVKGHSGGGLPISTAAISGQLQADRIDFFDASYGSWASNTYNSMKIKNPNLKINIVYMPNTSTQADALNLRNKEGVELIKTSVGHSNVPKHFFDK